MSSASPPSDSDLPAQLRQKKYEIELANNEITALQAEKEKEAFDLDAKEKPGILVFTQKDVESVPISSK